MSQNFLNTTTHSVAWLHKRFIADELQLKAPFQRNPVWTTKQKSFLIDTILRGYPIPELYMQEFTDAEGNDVYVVVDGQQRIRACEEFIQEKFKISREDTPEWADMKFDDLSEADRRKIYNYNFVVRILPDMPEPELRSMFARLNRNTVALKPQELRHATYWGEFITCMESLSDEDDWTHFSVFSPNDVRRMLDVEFISELAVAHLHGVQNKKDTLDDWYQAYEEEFEERNTIESVFRDVLGELNACLPELAKTRWRKKSDFYTLFLVFASMHDQLPFASDVRVRVGQALTQFSNDVDRFLRSPDENGDVSDAVKRYSAAVERAASDLGSRRRRRDELVAVLEGAIRNAE